MTVRRAGGTLIMLIRRYGAGRMPHAWRGGGRTAPGRPRWGRILTFATVLVLCSGFWMGVASIALSRCSAAALEPFSDDSVEALAHGAGEADASGRL